MNYLKNDLKNVGKIYSCIKNVGKNIYKSDTFLIHGRLGDMDKLEFTTIKTTSTFSASSPNCVTFFLPFTWKSLLVHQVGGCKSGYMPVNFHDPYHFQALKMKGYPSTACTTL